MFHQISIGVGPGAWVAYGILVILALVYVAFTLMLVIKLVEATVRIVGRIGFDSSNRVIDSGLLGTCGQLACCGSSRKRQRGHRRRHATAELPHSEVFSSPPAVLATVETGRGSTHSVQPPSVLRPEHALRPYREETDDESGFIMGAWQSSPRPGYSILQEPSPQQQSPVSEGSGFSRVGGGRAHFETPYAIASGSTQTFPSVRRGSDSTAPPHDDDSPPPSLSHVAWRQDTGSPLSATQPLHIRTKSQSAIIEDASIFNLSPTSRHTSASPSESRLQPPRVVIEADDDDDDSDSGQVKKKSWFNLRRQWPRSDGVPSANEGAFPPADVPSRSFVVVRDKKPQSSLRTPHPLSNPLTTEDSSSSAQDTPSSFVVLGRKGVSS